MMKTKEPAVSVIMAVYNGAQYLLPTLLSIRSQTFTDYEFIIVNDGSTDETQSIIEGFLDPNIRLINNSKNMGQTASLNVGLKHARGTYIARTDAGDISSPERFRKQIHYLKNHPHIDILGTDALEYDRRGNFCGHVFLSNRSSAILQRIFFACPVVHVSVMMRRDCMDQLGGYDESYKVLADYGLWGRALQHGFKFWNLREVLTGYLVDPDSFGNSNSRDRSVKEAVNIICDIAQSMTGINLSPDQAEDLYRFFVFGPQNLGIQRMSNTEALFESMLLKLNISRRDINYLFLRSYIKTLAESGRSFPSLQKNLQKKVIHDIIKRLSGVFSFYLFENLYGSFKYMWRRDYSAVGMNTPVFMYPAKKEANT